MFPAEFAKKNQKIAIVKINSKTTIITAVVTVNSNFGVPAIDFMALRVVILILITQSNAFPIAKLLNLVNLYPMILVASHTKQY